ncbi:ABC-type multidrug transport system ATPase subunit [Kitasatospora gansuensis]|uniref:ABC-type multidrug transport system ATPase subunit n=1 Tax=Kitasatospora gansuensis TaxID=258050 RepID=A0A7W7WM36_9ACTN|nr:ABC-type multidrug transport system ATPase subunit [Kitasatospora gansuensis]
MLFLDEPTTGLDPQSRTVLWELIRELVRDGTTVLLTTQYLEEADRLATRVVVVNEGRIIADDTPAVLKTRLGNTVIELGMGDEARAVRAATVLGGQLAEPPEREGALLRLASRDGSRLLLDVLHSLDTSGLVPSTVTVRESSLDDVFLALTGHRTRTGSDGPASSGGTS